MLDLVPCNSLVYDFVLCCDLVVPVGLLNYVRLLLFVNVANRNIIFNTSITVKIMTSLFIWKKLICVVVL